MGNNVSLMKGATTFMKDNEKSDEQVGGLSDEPTKKVWKTPEFKVHGDIVTLTQQKSIGGADGATFLGLDIGSV